MPFLRLAAVGRTRRYCRVALAHRRAAVDADAGVLAVPLSRSQPREGRYGRIAVGLLVFIIYFNMLSAGKAWVEQGKVHPRSGIWWVHGALLLRSILIC